MNTIRPKTHRRCLSLVCALTFSFFSLSAQLSSADSSESGSYGRAQDEFARHQYDKAIVSYRQYLRSHPNDQDAWTRFAAAYYHTGQAEQALKYLRKSRVSPGLKPFNLYYQALCYDALGDASRARRLLLRVSRMDDPLADDALFEKAAIDFAEGDAGAAKVAAEDYRRRFKNGRYRAAAESILSRLDEAGRFEIGESQRTLYKKSYFASNPLSLMSFPHSWVYQLGYDLTFGERVNPSSNAEQEPKPKPYSQQKIVTKAGLSLGPFSWERSTHSVGYVYGQDWLSDSDRINVWAEDPGDFEYFPYRPDLMERSHRLYLDSRYDLAAFAVGAYAHVEVLKGGSSLYPAPERKEIRKVFDIGTSTLFVPWIEWKYSQQHKVRAYAYFDKYLDAQDAVFSHKSYNLSGGNGAVPPSFSFELDSSLPAYRVDSKVEFFRWNYIYNDYWEGYVTTGGSGWVTMQPLASRGLPIFLTARATIAQRDYTSALIKSTPCAGGEGSATTCPRNDLYMKFGASLSYIRDKQQAFSVYFDYRQLKNDTLNVYNETSYDLLFALTHAFPTLDSGARYIEPPRGLFLSRGYF